MSDDDLVEVPFDKTSEQAILLLAAAEELGLGARVVKTTAGAFLVPQEVKDKAFAESPKSSPAKKAAAKSTTPKKAQE